MTVPREKHRAWAELVRTAAAVATLCLSAGLFADKIGWW
jgi:hypothetical protein